MKLQRLLALGAVALVGACTGDYDSPTAVQEEAPVTATAAVPFNPLFQMSFSSTEALLLAKDPGTIPDPTFISITNGAAAFASLGPPQINKVEYLSTGGGVIPAGDPVTGWLTGGLEMKSAFRVDLNLRAVRGLPQGVYRARITLSQFGLIKYYVYVTYVSGVYYADVASSPAGWTYSGLWHLAAGNNCMNPRGCTPAGPFHWYGSEATGDFDVPAGVANSGDAVSPAFDLPGTAVFPVVQIRTWYEIEYDVAPDDYDYMTVLLVEDGTNIETELGTINLSPGFVGNGTTLGNPLSPFTDYVVPIGGGLIPGTYHVVLRFETGDGSYNDYRGWGVAQIYVLEGLAPVAAAQRTGSIDARLLTGEIVKAGKVSTVQRNR